MPQSTNLEDIPLPKNWPQPINTAVIHTISLAHTAIIWSRSWAADSRLQRVKLSGELERARNEIFLLNEEIRIKDARMAKIASRHRPFYPATERMAILELRAARGWNLADTATRFMVEPETIASWMQRLGNEDDCLVQIPEPVNKYPAFVRYVVKRLKVLCPTMGKRRIAETLAKSGLHLGTTTVGRMLKDNATAPCRPVTTIEEKATARVVTARHPNHVWHIDMTIIPTSGFWTPWIPFSLPQVWPFCWWVAVILDHFSRVVVGFAIFTKQPSSEQIRRFMASAIRRCRKKPRHLISDKGHQFTSDEFRKWCKTRKIRKRFGAVGKYGSIAVIERFIRSMKNEGFRHFLVPLRLEDMRRELSLYVSWYNQHRPHQGLEGRIPFDFYHGNHADPPYYETRGNSSVKLFLIVSPLEDRRHLPIVELRQAA